MINAIMKSSLHLKQLDCYFLCQIYFNYYHLKTDLIKDGRVCFIEWEFCTERKERCDKGTSVFDSENIRVNIFTGYNLFCKNKYKEFRDYCGTIPVNTLKEEWNNLPDYQRISFNILAERDLNIANGLDNIVCVNTVRNFLVWQSGFCLRKDRILPSLDTAAIARRIVWAMTFWTF